MDKGLRLVQKKQCFFRGVCKCAGGTSRYSLRYLMSSLKSVTVNEIFSKTASGQTKVNTFLPVSRDESASFIPWGLNEFIVRCQTNIFISLQ